MLENDEEFESRENIDSIENVTCNNQICDDKNYDDRNFNDRNCEKGCCEKKPTPRIPMYSYEFTKSENVENESCEEKVESRIELINKIRSLDFAIVELAQYLDTHNTDKNALKLHKEYATALHDLKAKYQNKYGPLTINFPCNKWRWIEEPWPWERGNF